MLKRLGLLLLIGFFLSVTVRALQQQDTAQEESERSGPIVRLQRMFSGDEEESDRSDVDDSGIAREDVGVAPAGGATDPANADDSGNSDESNSAEESDTAGTGATAEDERPRRQRPNRAANDDANLMW
ncbi:MAG TPA: hypothetical protein V6D20_05935 [Candidatus Obscuribacterales bacterium]